ncbi:unnamed protein product [Linum trigynum]
MRRTMMKTNFLVHCKKNIMNGGGEEHDDGPLSLPGFRFHPTDEELVGFYLKRKVEKKALRIDIIKHLDVYKYQPWDLPTDAQGGGGEREWYFFCKRGRKYKNSVRPNRVTVSCGFWKATGLDKPIYSTGGGGDFCIGLKKSLVYYRGSAGKGTKTDWMMHEFRLPPSNTYEAEVWTLCRIFKREASYSKKADSHSCRTSAYESAGDSCCFPYRVLGDKLVDVINSKSSSSVWNHGCCSSDSQLMNFTNKDDDDYHQCQSSFCEQSSGLQQEESFEGGSWDELRPMVDFAFGHSIFYE